MSTPAFAIWGIAGDWDNERLLEYFAKLEIEVQLFEFEADDVKEEANLSSFPMVYARDLLLGDIEEFMAIPVVTLIRIETCVQNFEADG